MKYQSFSPKQRRVLTWWVPGNPDAGFDAIVCDGAVRSGKTLAMGLGFFLWAMSCFDGQKFGVCGKTIESLRRNVLSEILPRLQGLGMDWQEKRSENLVTVRFRGRDNRFYIFGGRDESSASLIQGITFAGVLLDEAALMPRSFVEQACARCSVAAVHIAKVDRATEVLRWAGAVCIQNGCKYDGVSQVYVVPVLATFTAVTEADKCTVGPGFYVYVNGLLQPYAVSFLEEERTGCQAEFVTGESAPAGTSRGSTLWEIQLEELIPAGSPENPEPVGNFELRVDTELKKETYYHCDWSSIRREFTKDGLRRIRRGVAMDRREKANG